MTETISLNSDARLPRVGQRVQYFGDFELIEQVAHGGMGMGMVFKARQISLNRSVGREGSARPDNSLRRSS